MQTVPQIRITTGRLTAENQHYDILIAGRPKRSHLESSPHLRSVIIPFAGIPEKTRKLLLEFPDIDVHNLHHNSIPTAELAVALLFSAAKFILPFDRSLRSNDWRPRYQDNPSMLMYEKKLLILGFGHIGQHVGKICQAAGMDVMAIRKSLEFPSGPINSARIYPPEALDDLLSQVNALVVTLPLTPDTRGIVGKQQLGLLPSGSILVNVGRGSIVDEEALFRALDSGHLAGAGLDVWYNYPENPDDRRDTPPADHPFHQLNNVVMSPHRGGSTRETERLRMDHLAKLLNAAARGELMTNKVNIQAGY